MGMDGSASPPSLCYSTRQVSEYINSRYKKFRHCFDSFYGIGDFDYWDRIEILKLSIPDKLELLKLLIEDETQKLNSDFLDREYLGINVDHNHSSNKVRQLLCVSCNRGLGCFYENIESFERALIYLKKWNENPDTRRDCNVDLNSFEFEKFMGHYEEVVDINQTKEVPASNGVCGVPAMVVALEGTNPILSAISLRL